MPASQLIPKKHAMVLTSHSATETRKLYLEHPDMPIKKVLMTILEDLTDDIPPPLMLKLTKNIIDTWTKMAAATQQESATAIAA